jgi:DNA-binding NarL/FixJ family response regulator
LKSNGPGARAAPSAFRSAATAERTAQRGDVSSGRSGRAPRILIVEDDYIVSLEIEHALTQAGFVVVGMVGAAEAAIAQALALAPTLVIMDIRLRGPRDGIDAATEIYSQTGIRSIFATAHQDETVRHRARAAAPLGWLPKPYDPNALIELIREVLSAD